MGQSPGQSRRKYCVGGQRAKDPRVRAKKSEINASNRGPTATYPHSTSVSLSIGVINFPLGPRRCGATAISCSGTRFRKANSREDRVSGTYRSANSREDRVSGTLSVANSRVAVVPEQCCPLTSATNVSGATDVPTNHTHQPYLTCRLES